MGNELLNNILIASLSALLCPFLLNVLLSLLNRRNKINEVLCKQMLFDIYIPLDNLTSLDIKLFEMMKKKPYMDQIDFIFRELTKFYKKLQKDVRIEILVDPFVLKHLSFSNFSDRNLFFRLIKLWHYKCLRKNVKKHINKLKQKLGYPTVVGRSKLAKFWFTVWYIVNLMIAFLPQEWNIVYIQIPLILLWFISILFAIKYLKYFFYEI